MSSVYAVGGTPNSSSSPTFVDLAVGAQQDSFGRLRVSQPY